MWASSCPASQSHGKSVSRESSAGTLLTSQDLDDLFLVQHTALAHQKAEHGCASMWSTPSSPATVNSLELQSY